MREGSVGKKEPNVYEKNAGFTSVVTSRISLALSAAAGQLSRRGGEQL